MEAWSQAYPSDEFPGRRLALPLHGAWTIWYQQSRPPARDSEAWAYDMQDAFGTADTEALVRLPQGYADIARNRVITIEYVLLDAAAEKEYNASHARAEGHAAEFFRNRGLGLASPADDVRALYFAAYFLELVLGRHRGFPVRVLEIRGKSAEGKPMRLEEGELRHWAP